MAKIDKSMTVIDILNIDADIAQILMEEGMHCIFCHGAAFESLQEAGYVHGIDDEHMDLLVDKINAYLAEGEESTVSAT